MIIDERVVYDTKTRHRDPRLICGSTNKQRSRGSDVTAPKGHPSVNFTFLIHIRPHQAFKQPSRLGRYVRTKKSGVKSTTQVPHWWDTTPPTCIFLQDDSSYNTSNGLAPSSYECSTTSFVSNLDKFVKWCDLKDHSKDLSSIDENSSTA